MKLVHAQIYLAPMEGITTYIYRNAQAAVYGRLDKYLPRFWSRTRSGALRNGNCRRFCRRTTKASLWCLRF